MLLNVFTIRLLLIFFLLSVILSTTFSSSPINQQIWGTFGRSNGILTHLSFLLVFLGAIVYVKHNEIAFLFKAFTRLSYFITGYAIVQVASLDPINWSQKFVVATLGNINFVSSLLGLANSLFVSKLILEKLFVSQRIHYCILIVINTSICFYVGSIQGALMTFLAVAIATAVRIFQHLSIYTQILSIVIFVGGGITSFLGSLGRGPLASYLYQETSVFRLDYWTAGMNMIKASPLVGFGFDSYGDYYRQFRTLDAVIRTGPQRVTNTAHNVFIDYWVSGGIFAALLLVLIWSVPAISFLRRFQEVSSNNTNCKELFVLNCSWAVFLMISINQIGVTVWGFLFSGLLFGLTSLQLMNDDVVKSKQKLKYIQKNKANRLRLPNEERSLRAMPGDSTIKWKSIIFVFTVLIFYLPPAVADANFYRAIRSQDDIEISKALNLVGIQSFHAEKAIEYYVRTGKDEKAVLTAKWLANKDPRNFYAWSTIALAPSQSRLERKRAVEALMRLDPNNSKLMEQFESLFRKI